MELRDLIVTPIILFLVYAVAYVVRPWVTDAVNRRYFLPALTVRILGALAVGFLYQFYYDGGDTFMYHTHGSRHLWGAIIDAPQVGLDLLLGDKDTPGGYQYFSKIYFFNDAQSYAIIRLATIFDLITFSTYSATAVLFACLAFTGMWLFYLTFYEQYPHLHKRLAIASLFIPSVFFWGSGLLKDTITLACLGAAIFLVYRILIRKQVRVLFVFLLLVSLYGIYVIKVYILLTFLPAIILWLSLYYFNKVRPYFLRPLLLPAVISVSLFLAYLTVETAGKDHAKYSLSMISQTAQITAYDIRYWSGRDAGSGYALGQLDGSWESMLRLAPAGITVSLFRPFLWEVNNPLMLLAATESLALSIVTLLVLILLRSKVFKAIQEPAIFFCLVFSITFAFAVGVSTFNFGTLVRYKIPLMPLYAVALVLLLDYRNRERNRGVSASTE